MGNETYLESTLNPLPSEMENLNDSLIPTKGDDNPTNMFGFITEGILLTSISTFGFIGNAMSVYVLLKGSVKGLFSSLLTNLALFDGLFLIMAILTFGLPTLSSTYKSNVFLKIMPVCYGFTHVFRVGSVYSTLSVTMERFFAIVLPFKDFEILKKWLVPGTAIFAISYNIPKFFEVTSVTDPETNLTSIQGTALRLNSYYVSYYVFWSKFIFIEFVPYILIVIMNSFIVVKIIKSSRFRRKIMFNMSQQTPFKDVSSPQKIQSMSEEQMKYFENQRQEHKLGVLLVVISVLFITCQSFKLIPDLFEVLSCRNVKPCYTSAFVNKVVELSHLLLCLNSSLNFMVYLLGGEKFRKIWIHTYVPDSCVRAMGCEPLVRANSLNNTALNRNMSCRSTFRPGSTNHPANHIRLKALNSDAKKVVCDETTTFITLSQSSRENTNGIGSEIPNRV
ncbi:FMRFamide receptor-like [Tigriopus californicus]|nr:FMRFamide receptor-like [Tigriopus californicus]